MTSFFCAVTPLSYCFCLHIPSCLSMWRDNQDEKGRPGLITHPDGRTVKGPKVSWKGRRLGPRQSRRWATAWSREQISRRLELDFPGDMTMRISQEAIYQALYIQGRGALKRELTACLRTGRALRVPRAKSTGRGKSFVLPEIMISERPADAADRAVPGHRLSTPPEWRELGAQTKDNKWPDHRSEPEVRGSSDFRSRNRSYCPRRAHSGCSGWAPRYQKVPGPGSASGRHTA